MYMSTISYDLRLECTHNARYQTCHGDLWNILSTCYHAMIEAAKILDQLIILVMSIWKSLKRDTGIEHTIPTIFRRVYDSCRMRREANQVNPILLAVNCLQTSGNN